MMKRFKVRQGFTLIEILIVLGIIILLAGTAIVALVPQQRGARIDTTRIKLKNIETALEAYNINIGHYPTDEEGGLGALLTKPAFADETIAAQWRGPYLKEDPRDAWSNKFNYQVTQAGTPEADQTPYKLWSNGPDGTDGTDDDIKNWSDQTLGKP
jgi:general secretion pathway protein G